ncbi:MAG: DUF4097 domain-containing protein [Thermoanaerobaculia bacterium]
MYDSHEYPILAGLPARRWMLAAAATFLFAAIPVAAERLTIPLTDPAKPAQLEVSLVQGSIRVVGTANREVTIEATSEEAESHFGREQRGDHKGMQRIPNTALGLEAEEKDNHVAVSAESWAREVNLKIEVPAGSSLELSTVNGGDIVVENVTGELDLHNTNGEIHVKDARGPVSATTVNGDVSVVFSATMVAAPMAFSTLNGDVDVTLPASLKVDVRMKSDNGEIFSDFDIAMNSSPPKVEEERSKGRYRVVVAREMVGKIGGGGPELFLKTFNGDILLRRRN